MALRDEFFSPVNWEDYVTLEDVWCILWIPIHGEMVTYQPWSRIKSLCELYEYDPKELGMCDLYKIIWRMLMVVYDRYIVVLYSLIVSMLFPDM